MQSKICLEPNSIDNYFELLDISSVDTKGIERFYKNSIINAQFHFFDNSFYFPLIPRLECLSMDNKYWVDWDDPNENKEVLKKTIDKIISYI